MPMTLLHSLLQLDGSLLCNQAQKEGQEQDEAKSCRSAEDQVWLSCIEVSTALPTINYCIRNSHQSVCGFLFAPRSSDPNDAAAESSIPGHVKGCCLRSLGHWPQLPQVRSTRGTLPPHPQAPRRAPMLPMC